MRNWVFLALAPGFWGCGDVSNADSVGGALFTVNGRLDTGVLEPPQGSYASLLGWFSFGGGPLIECLAENSPFDCNLRGDYESALAIEAAELRPQFPSRFELDIVSLPHPDTTLSYKGGVLALGGVAVFDDRNNNGSLDFTSPGATEAVDRIVAESALTQTKSGIVFREGPLHPYWELFRLLGCPAPPQGFSMVSLPRTFACELTPMDDLIMVRTTQETSERALCGTQIEQFGLMERSAQPVEEPSGATFECADDGNSLNCYVDRCNLCDRFQLIELKLKGCDEPDACWDFEPAPPAWWPCPRA